MASAQHTIVGLGELLWDMFPQGKQLGGAPANFAYMTALLGDRGIVASRVGADRLGQEAIWQLKSSGLDTDQIQADTKHLTGTVLVHVDASGQPEYRIIEDVAWDHLQWTPEWKTLAESANAVCFGSLAQRSEDSRRTIQEFLKALRPGSTCVFDVNLRQSFFTKEILCESARQAVILKLNHEELPRFAEILGFPPARDAATARRLVSEFGIRLICITRGARGSLLVTRTEEHEHPGFPVKVGDTVGAGDAFTAALVHHALRGASLAVMNEGANRMGAWVASQEGAMPAADEAILVEVRDTQT
ncbi:MAG TPA: carbohydrate kinase [Terriglobales bacterium]|nr:carbohydrate kinase [Terriglobales bacterium]